MNILQKLQNLKTSLQEKPEVVCMTKDVVPTSEVISPIVVQPFNLSTWAEARVAEMISLAEQQEKSAAGQKIEDLEAQKEQVALAKGRVGALQKEVVSLTNRFDEAMKGLNRMVGKAIHETAENQAKSLPSAEEQKILLAEKKDLNSLIEEMGRKITEQDLDEAIDRIQDIKDLLRGGNRDQVEEKKANLLEDKHFVLMVRHCLKSQPSYQRQVENCRGIWKELHGIPNESYGVAGELHEAIVELGRISRMEVPLEKALEENFFEKISAWVSKAEGPTAEAAQSAYQMFLDGEIDIPTEEKSTWHQRPVNYGEQGSRKATPPKKDKKGDHKRARFVRS